MTIQQVREFFGKHSPVTAALGALGAALDARASGVPLPPPLAARVDELLAAVGAGDILDGVSAEEARPMVSLIQAIAMLDQRLVDPNRRMSWSYVDPELLQAIGDASSGHAMHLSHGVIPTLGDLAERMRGKGAAFLDVGTGVGALAITMTKLWPEVKVTGIDPWQPAMALARTNVAKAGLEDRIELRELAGEQLEDEAAFDLAWVAVPFMQERAIAPTCARVLRALRPGGWVVVAIPPTTGEDPASAAFRLRMTAWAGHAITPGQIEELLLGKGFTEVRTLPSQGGPNCTVVGRRA